MNPRPQQPSPFESAEAINRRSWHQMAREGNLNVVRAISAWSDICGFSSLLERCGWDLDAAKSAGIFTTLASAYQTFGVPFIVGAPPMPSERVLVLNDGIARTIDLHEQYEPIPQLLIFYIRDLLMRHFMLENSLFEQGLGLRTVLAGGERCQYSPESVTGVSVLHRAAEPTEFGKSILGQQFVYHPSEFQMNTAFAMAYSIDNLGSKNGVVPNRVYIESRWIDALNQFSPGLLETRESAVDACFNGNVLLTIRFDSEMPVTLKGKSSRVFRVAGMTVHPALDGNEVVFPMNEHDRPIDEARLTPKPNE